MINQKDRIEAAIRHIKTSVDIDPWAMELAVDALKAQGTCEDAVSRQTLQKELALYLIDDVTSEDEAGYNRAINDVQKMVLHLPSAQPELHYDEWCTDCKEYDHERHCCPRWNRVIRETLKDVQPNTDHIYAELSKVYNVKGLPDEAIGIIGDLMLSLDGPSAQPERLTDDDFETIRIHLNAYKEKLCNQKRWKEAEEYQRIIDRFMAFASAQPERKTGKWMPTEPDAPCFYRCDHCGRLLDFPECFCPTCGTDMRGESNE